MRAMAAGMTWHSQAGQDAWVIEQHGDGPGYFVDIGAHDGVTHSNTYALERRGWTGVCIEPDPGAFGELVGNRRCVLNDDAISDHQGVVTIMPTGRIVKCRRLAYLLPLIDAPPVIDYLSIDVEGHELQVLAGMDFDRWKVRLITIEHNRYSDGTARKDAIYACLTGVGFERVVEDVVAPGYGEYEDWYSRT